MRVLLQKMTNRSSNSAHTPSSSRDVWSVPLVQFLVSLRILHRNPSYAAMEFRTRTAEKGYLHVIIMPSSWLRLAARELCWTLPALNVADLWRHGWISVSGGSSCVMASAMTDASITPHISLGNHRSLLRRQRLRLKRFSV